MKHSKNILRMISICLLCIMLALTLAACKKDGEGGIFDGGKTVPSYQGMSISKLNSHSLAASEALSIAYADKKDEGNSGNNGNNGNKDENGPPDENQGGGQGVPGSGSGKWDDGAHNDFEYESKEEVKEEIKDVVSIQVSGSPQTEYYVTPGEVFTVEIHISNPDQFEILSFTLNGQKYSNYMFKENSTMELLLLDVTAPMEPGYFELTIDAIKYVDGTDIKDVRMEGDQTIKAGVAYTKAPYAEFTDISIDTTAISLNVTVSDPQSVIGSNAVVFFLSDGENPIFQQELQLGNNSVNITGLLMGKAYEYGVLTSYDAVDGKGVEAHWIGTRNMETNKGFLITNATIGKERMEFTVEQNGTVGTINSIVLFDGKTGEAVTTLADNSLRAFEGLLSNHDYRITLTFSYPQGENTVTDSCTISFTTPAKETPTVAVTDVTETQTSFTFDLATTDPDGILKIDTLQLYLGEQLIKEVADNTVRLFDGLLSNNTYTLKVNYSYDLNDGAGVQSKTVQKQIKTVAKTAPTVSIDNIISSRTDISFAVGSVDVDGILNIDKIELYLDETLVSASEIKNDVFFDGLTAGTRYTAKITYSYDLNDGKGVHTESVTREYPTIAASISIEEILLLNTNVVKKGEEINLSIFFINSSEIEFKSIYVNGQQVTVVGGDRKTSAIVKFVPDDTGLVEFVVDRVDYEYYGETISQRIDSDVSVSYPVYNDLQVTFTPISASPYEYTGGGIYLEFANPDGYTVYKINDSTDFIRLSENQFIVPSNGEYWNENTNRIKSIEYGYDDFGHTVQTFDFYAGNNIFQYINNGSESRVFQTVSTIEEFLAMTNGYYILTADLDFRRVESVDIQFRGVLYGNGHTVRGLKQIVDTATKDYRPLFNEGSIYDVNFTELYITVTTDSIYVNVVPFGGTKLVNCTMSGDVICAGSNINFQVLPWDQTFSETVTYNLNVTVQGNSQKQSQTAFKQAEKDPHVILQDNFIFYVCEGGYTILLGYYGEDANVIIPTEVNGNKVGMIGEYVFSRLSGLTAVTIPEGIVSIGRYAFANCPNLESVTIADSVISIEEYAFYYCEKLKTLTLGTGIRSMDRGIFEGCSQLTDLYIKDLLSFMQIDFAETWGCNPIRYAKNLYVGGVLTTELVVPEGVTHIPDYMFENCQIFTSLVLPDSLISIGDHAFQSCSNLRKITFGKNLTTIGKYAFGWTNVDYLVIPASVTTIGEYGIATNNQIYSQAASQPEGWHVNWRGDVQEWTPAVKWSTEDVVTDENGITYVLYFDGTAKIIFLSWTDITIPERLEIPATVKGHTVTHITSGSLGWNNERWKYLVIPTTVTTIEENAVNHWDLNIYVRGAQRPAGWAENWTNSQNIIWNYKEDYTDENGLVFIITNDGKATLKEYTGNAAEIVIPATVNGCPVVAIGNNVFRGRNSSGNGYTAITSVILPEGLLSIGDYAFANCYDMTLCNIPASVTSIGIYAFENCRGLTTVIIPDGVTVISEFAFYCCDQLANVTFGKNVKVIERYAFASCSSLTAAILPDALETIGENAFGECRSMTTLAFGKNLKVIESRAFTSCHSISVLALPEGLEVVGEYVFSNCRLSALTLPSTLKEIGAHAFNSAGSLGEIVIPASVTDIGADAFSYSGISTIYVGGTANSKPEGWHDHWNRMYEPTQYYNVVWGFKAFHTDAQGVRYLLFADNTAAVLDYQGTLNAITIPATIEGCSVLVINESAFWERSQLTSITLSEGLRIIGNRAFAYTSVSSIVIPASVETIGNNIFGSNHATIYVKVASKPEGWSDNWSRKTDSDYYCDVIWNFGSFFTDEQGITYALFNDNTAMVYSYTGTVTELVIPATVEGHTVTAIGNNVFRDNKDLVSVTLPEGLLSIGTYAFWNCSKMAVCNIPTTLTSIGAHAFENCRALTTVAIPDGVTVIPEAAFSGCNKLTTVTFGKNVKIIEAYAFQSCNKFTAIILPEGVERVGERAFAECSDVKQLTLPSTLKEISICAFCNLYNLHEVVIPASVTTIGECAFFGGSNKVLYCTVTSKPAGWHTNWNTQNDWEGTDHSVVWNFKTFYTDEQGVVYALFNDNTAVVHTYKGTLTAITIPASVGGCAVTAIGDRSFEGQSSLVTVILPEGLLTIGESAFSSCNSLTGLQLPSTLTSIGSYAFSWNYALTNLIIPQSVTKIGERIFQYSNNQSNVYVGAASKPSGWHVNWCYLDDYNNLNVVWNFKCMYTDEQGITYALFNDNTATVYSYNGTEANLVIPSTVEGCSVTGIAQSVFADKRTIETVTLPEGLLTIGDYAFQGCSKMMSCNIPTTVTSIGMGAFTGCRALVSVTIPDGVTVIKEHTFSSCSKLVNVTFGKNVKTIENHAFHNCSELARVALPEGLLTIEEQAFSSCGQLAEVIFPSTLQSVGSEAFVYNNALREVVIPASVTTIGQRAFAYGNMKNIYTSNTSKPTGWDPEWCYYSDIDDYNVVWGFVGFHTDANGVVYALFKDNSACVTGYAGTGTTVTVPAAVEGYTVTTVEARAFSQNRDIESVTLPEGLLSIGADAFWNCSEMAVCNIPTTLTSIGAYAFGGCTSLLTVTIPDGVTKIENGTFSNCQKLTTVVFGTGLKSIGDYAFSSCNTLAIQSLPEGLESIGMDAFFNCAIVDIVLPSTLMTIGEGAFSYNHSLKTVMIPASVTTVGGNIFAWGGDATVYVPVASKPTGWSSSWNFRSETESLDVVWDFERFYTDHQGITYVLIGNGTATAVKYAGNAAEIVVLDIVEGYSVTALGDNLFNDRDSITKVTLPEGLLTIGAYAFSNCDNLSECDIPSTVTSIGGSAFMGCSILRSITVPDGVTKIESWTFAHCSNLETVVLGANVKSIGEYAFAYGYTLAQINLPEGLTSIEQRVFAGCHSLRSVIIPASVTVIGSYVFESASSLTINVRAASQPAGWAGDWYYNLPEGNIVWGYTV